VAATLVLQMVENFKKYNDGVAYCHDVRITFYENNSFGSKVTG
jgi:hypothetical protein